MTAVHVFIEIQLESKNLCPKTLYENIEKKGAAIGEWYIAAHQ